MAKIQDIDLPHLEFAEAAAPSTPASGIVRIYAKSDGFLYGKDDAGTETALSNGSAGAVATDAIWDAAGDLVQGTGANTAARLALGAAGTVVRSTGSANAYAYPPGYEIDYVQVTSSVNITATSEATADTAVTGSAIAYDGSTVVMIEFYCASFTPDAGAAGRYLQVWLYDGSGSIGEIGFVQTPAAAAMYGTLLGRRRLTPSAATHTYSIRGSVNAGTGTLACGTGGSGTILPMYIRITKV